MSIAVRVLSDVVIVETLEGPFVDPNNPTVTTSLNTTADLNSATTPPVTKYSAFRKALSAGTASIDLTSLPDNNGTAGAVTFLGLKVQVGKFRNPSTNANEIVITEGASNGHPLAGAAWKLTLQPGDVWEYKGNDAGTDVAAGDKTWDLTGTGVQALDVELVAG